MTGGLYLSRDSLYMKKPSLSYNGSVKNSRLSSMMVGIKNQGQELFKKNYVLKLDCWLVCLKNEGLIVYIKIQGCRMIPNIAEWFYKSIY